MSLDHSMEKMETDAASLPIHEDLFTLTHTKTVASLASLLSLFFAFFTTKNWTWLAVCISQMITTSFCVASLSQVEVCISCCFLQIVNIPGFLTMIGEQFSHTQQKRKLFSVCYARGDTPTWPASFLQVRGTCSEFHCYLLHTRTFRNVTELPCSPQSPRGISVLNNAVV